jgi:predicted DNA-binding transcriptional regulator AlpA
MTRATIPLAFLTMRQAAEYLSVSRSYFIDHVRPSLAAHDFRAPGTRKPMPRWSRTDLDAWALARRKGAA